MQSNVFSLISVSPVRSRESDSTDYLYSPCSTASVYHFFISVIKRLFCCGLRGWFPWNHYITHFPGTQSFLNDEVGYEYNARTFEYHYSFVVYGCVGVFRAWLNSKCQEPAEKMADMADAIIRRGSLSIAWLRIYSTYVSCLVCWTFWQQCSESTKWQRGWIWLYLSFSY